MADPPHFNLGLVFKKSEYFPPIMDMNKSATKGASVGSPMEVVKVIVRALKLVVGEARPNGCNARSASLTYPMLNPSYVRSDNQSRVFQ